MQLLAANNAQTVLAAGINASATAITVSSGAGVLFPVPVSGTSLFKLSLTDAATESVREIVHVTSVSGDVFTVIRGQEGTAARSWSANDIAANMVTAGTLSFFAQLDSPVFTGDPKAPTAAAGDNDTTIATTAFVATGLATRALLAGNTNQQFYVQNATSNAQAVNLGQLNTGLATKAAISGNPNIDFAVQGGTSNNSAVNLYQLTSGLAGKAAYNGTASQTFNVAQASSGTQAVRLDQFQSGSNGNGAWIKFPNGSQWCRTNISIPANSSASWNFPLGFASAPAVFLTNISGDQALWPTGVGASGTQIYNSLSQTANVNLLAIY